MKFSIPASTLSEAAAFAAKAIGKNPVTPIMGGLRIDVQPDGIHLSGSDYEQTAKAHVEADVDNPGLIVLQATTLTNVLGKLRNRTCTVERTGTTVKLSAGSAQFTLHCMPETEYPALASPPAVVGTVDGDALAHAVNMVIGAVSNDEALPVLMGINMVAHGDELTLMTTDRYRLATATLNWEPNGTDDFTALVKGSWLHGIAKGLVGRAELQHNGNQIGIDAGPRSSFSNVMEGEKYPKIGTLFPDTWHTEAVIDRAVFAEAVDRVATVAERNTPIRLRFENDTVTMDAGTGEASQGEASQGEEVIECEYDGDPATAAFNPGYLGWSISTLATEKISVRLQSNMAKPVLLVPSVGESKHLIMPIRLPNVA